MGKIEVIYYINRGSGKTLQIIISKKLSISFSEDRLCLSPDEMLHYAAFPLGFHCLPKYPYREG